MKDNNLANLVNLCVASMTQSKAEIFEKSEGKIKDADAFIRDKFAEVYGTRTPKYKDFKNNNAYFQIIEEVLNLEGFRGIEENTFYNQFAETIFIDRGDRYEFYMENEGIISFSEFAGDHWDINRQKLGEGTSFTVPTKVYAAGMYDDFLQFMRGRITFEKMINAVSRGLKEKIDQEVAASFTAAGSQLPTQFTVTGAYDEEKLIELHSHVEASGGSAIVVGTKKALSKITKGSNIYNTYTDAMKRELHSTGNVGEFLGMTLVELPAVHKAGTFDFAYRDDQLLILPVGGTARPIKILIEGELEFSRDIRDPRSHYDMSYEHKVITRFGTAVVFNNGLFGIYNLV